MTTKTTEREAGPQADQAQRAQLRKLEKELTFYKLLQGNTPYHGGDPDFRYSRPTAARPGRWHHHAGEVVLCQSGFHVTTDPREWWFAGSSVYVAEVRGLANDPAKDRRRKAVCRSIRLVRELSEAELRRKFGLPFELSPAMDHLTTVWNTFGRLRRHSWRELNGAMAAALDAAIRSQRRFDELDLQYIESQFRPRYWMNREVSYATAIEVSNESACRALERGRRVFRDKHKARFTVGSRLRFADARWTVTSIRNDVVLPGARAEAILCQHAEGTRKVTRRRVVPRGVLAKEAEVL